MTDLTTIKIIDNQFDQENCEVHQYDEEDPDDDDSDENNGDELE